MYLYSARSGQIRIPLASIRFVSYSAHECLRPVRLKECSYFVKNKHGQENHSSHNHHANVRLGCAIVGLSANTEHTFVHSLFSKA